MTSDNTVSGDDRFRAPAPIIDLTPEVVANLRKLLDKAQKFASTNGLPWRRGASAGKPLLLSGAEGRGACLAYGTIGSWNEIDLAVAAVNALPALLAAHRALLNDAPVVERVLRPADGTELSHSDGWRILRSVDPDGPEPMLLWERLPQARSTSSVDGEMLEALKVIVEFGLNSEREAMARNLITRAESAAS